MSWESRRAGRRAGEAAVGWTYRRHNFPARDYLPIDENHPLRAQDQYGLSKIAGEAIARSYSDGYQMETVAIRPPWVCALRGTGGAAKTRRPPGQQAFSCYNYVDVRDLAQVFRLSRNRGGTAYHGPRCAARGER